MGKSQTKKKILAKSRRHNPIRVPDTHLPHGRDIAGQSSASGAANGAGQGQGGKSEGGKGKVRGEEVIPVIAKLSSPSPSDRSWACAAISTLITNDPGTRRLFLGKGVVGVLVGILQRGLGGGGEEGEVLVEAAGCLRNLAIDGGHEVCSAMYNKGILNPLAAFVPQIGAAIQSLLAGEAVKPEQGSLEPKAVFLLAENVLTLFWCLSETSNKILNALNQLHLETFLLAFLVHREKIPSSVVVAAAQCLYAITLDNPPFTSSLYKQPDASPTLLDVVQSDSLNIKEEPETKGKGKAKKEEMEVETEKSTAAQDIQRERATLLKVLAAGILHNLQEEGEIAEGLDNHIIGPMLKPVLDVDLAALAGEVEKTVAAIPEPAAKTAKEIKEIKTDHRSSEELKLDSLEKRLSTLMVALEVMTSVCAGLIDAEEQIKEEEGEDEEEADGMEEGEDEEMNSDAESADEKLIAKGRDQPAEGSGLNGSEVETKRTATTSLDGLVASNLHTKFFALANATSLSYPPTDATPSVHPPSTALLSSVHVRALEALNNFLLTISSYGPNPTPPLPAGVNDRASDRLAAQEQWQQFVAGSFADVQGLWAGSFEIGRQVAGARVEVLGMTGQEVRAEILEVLAGVWMSLARIGAFGGITVTEEQITSLIQAYSALPSATFKTRIISTLSSLAMRSGASQAENKVIGDFLFSIIGSIAASKPEEIVAALNAVFDVYADERCTYDGVFSSGGYLAKLSSVVSKCRTMTRAVDKRKVPELRAQADEAYENLVAFIKYRRSVA